MPGGYMTYLIILFEGRDPDLKRAMRAICRCPGLRRGDESDGVTDQKSRLASS
jgi:hypothetical protein